MTDWFGALNTTWPALSTSQSGPFTLRVGAGGGKRTSAATLDAPMADGDLGRAEFAMRSRNQRPLFMVRDGQTDLDAATAARNYAIVDPTTLYACKVGDLLKADAPPVSGFSIWPPLAMMVDLWAENGIGPARQAVMDRATCPKTAFLARSKDRASGVAYAGLYDKICMVHALEVAEGLRRSGAASNIMRHAAKWAQNADAEYLAVAVTDANAAGNALYVSLGMNVVGHYHYRIAPQE